MRPIILALKMLFYSLEIGFSNICQRCKRTKVLKLLTYHAIQEETFILHKSHQILFPKKQVIIILPGLWGLGVDVACGAFIDNGCVVVGEVVVAANDADTVGTLLLFWSVSSAPGPLPLEHKGMECRTPIVEIYHTKLVLTIWTKLNN